MKILKVTQTYNIRFKNCYNFILLNSSLEGETPAQKSGLNVSAN